MSKSKIEYVCNSCGSVYPKWYGKCPDCGNWNTLTEQIRESDPLKNKISINDDGNVQKLSEVEFINEHRERTGIAELDRVLGGGIVSGSVVLLVGEPGIGKSTMLLQICRQLSERMSVLYISGEESARQLKLRARRMNIHSDNIYVSSSTDIEQVIRSAHHYKPQILMIDSIQTMTNSELNSSAGSITQIRESASLLISYAKSTETPVFIVGHVNKEGAIAGPKILEHMVDTVLYFEGDKKLDYRILRTAKNRFGSTNEIGMFTMTESGLEQVENPSKMLISGRPSSVSGTCVACVMEGSRPILAEIQALAGKSSFAYPRRMATGFDNNRLTMLLAVLEKRGGYPLSMLDIYVNVVGGLKIDEPAADLPVALAVISNVLDKPIPDNILAMGELGLAGEIRSVGNVQLRITECERLGFKNIIVPKHNHARNNNTSVNIIEADNLADAVNACFKYTE